MIEQIKKCQSCNLCFHQEPLLDTKRECQVFWVGLSAKMAKSQDEIPLSPDTNSGMLIQKIEENLGDISTYKTNLVKCVPLDERGKLRYPSKKEIDCCFPNLLEEIKALAPKIIFLLGEKVSTSVGNHLDIKFDKWEGFDYSYKEQEGIFYVPIHHPSYIYVYRRKETDEYIRGIMKITEKLL